MPADSGMYKLIPQPRYLKELARIDDAEVLADIQAAEEAIAHAPYHPAPRTAYKLLPQPEESGATEPLHLLIALQRVQILKHGFVISYTIREAGELVYLEDLDLPFKYRLPKFQP